VHPFKLFKFQFLFSEFDLGKYRHCGFTIKFMIVIETREYRKKGELIAALALIKLSPPFCTRNATLRRVSHNSQNVQHLCHNQHKTLHTPCPIRIQPEIVSSPSGINMVNAEDVITKGAVPYVSMLAEILDMTDNKQ
jgi:hypothetical protein